MTVNDITSLIGTVGFPIAAFLGLGAFMVYYIMKKEKQISEINETYTENLVSLLESEQETISKLTETLTELKNAIESKEG